MLYVLTFNNRLAEHNRQSTATNSTNYRGGNSNAAYNPGRMDTDRREHDDRDRRDYEGDR